MIVNWSWSSSSMGNVHLWLQILADIGHGGVGVGGGELVVAKDWVVGQEHALWDRLGRTLGWEVGGVIGGVVHILNLLQSQGWGSGVVLVLEEMIELGHIGDDAELVWDVWI